MDGSGESARALDWAISYAQQSGAVLDIVTAWMFPMAIGYAFTTTVAEVRQKALDLLAEAVSHVAEVAPDVVVRSEANEQPAGPALVMASKGADLLGCGVSRHGGLRGAAGRLGRPLLHATRILLGGYRPLNDVPALGDRLPCPQSDRRAGRPAFTLLRHNCHRDDRALCKLEARAPEERPLMRVGTAGAHHQEIGRLWWHRSCGAALSMGHRRPRTIRSVLGHSPLLRPSRKADSRCTAT